MLELTLGDIYLCTKEVTSELNGSNTHFPKKGDIYQLLDYHEGKIDLRHGSTVFVFDEDVFIEHFTKITNHKVKTGEIYACTKRMIEKNENEETIVAEYGFFYTVIDYAESAVVLSDGKNIFKCTNDSFEEHFTKITENKETTSSADNEKHYVCQFDFHMMNDYDRKILVKKNSIWTVKATYNESLHIQHKNDSLFIRKDVFNENFKSLVAMHEKWVAETEERLFEKARFAELGKSDDYIFQALAFIGTASQQLSLATTVLRNDEYVSPVMKMQLKAIQNEIHAFCELLRSVPRVDER